jgi:hypothetical protein
MLLPDALRQNDTVRIVSSTPGAGARVNVGGLVELRVEYRIQPFLPTQSYYLLACGIENCRTNPPFVRRIRSAKGTESVTFPLTEEPSYVMVVIGEPIFRYDCPPSAASACWPDTNSIGSDSVLVRIDGGG